MQFYWSELIASILFFSTASCSPTRHSKTMIKDGSFVLIDVESRSFICFNLRVLNQLLFRARIAFHNLADDVQAQPLALLELSQIVVAGFLQFFEFPRVQLEMIIKRQNIDLNQFQLHRPAAHRVASFHSLVIAACLRSRRAHRAALEARESTRERQPGRFSAVLQSRRCAAVTPGWILCTFESSPPACGGRVVAAETRKLEKEIRSKFTICHRFAVDFAEFVVETVNLLLSVSLLDDSMVGDVKVDALEQQMLRCCLSNPLVNVGECERAILAFHHREQLLSQRLGFD